LTNQKPGKTFEETMVAIGDGLSDLASSDNGADGENEDVEDKEQGKLSENNEPGWVMGTMTKTEQQYMERFRQKQMKLDEITQPGWEDAPDYCCERDKKYSTSKMIVPAVVQPQTDDDAAASAPKHLESIWSVFILSPEYRKCCKGLLDQEVVRLG
jgi:hypothetical protein